MAKKQNTSKKGKEVEKDNYAIELVTNSDQSAEAVTNCDNLKMDVAKCDLQNVNIESMIRVIRGQQVLLDFDLAFLYGVETRRLNEQVKRNLERFPGDFMFQLTKSELEVLRSQIATAKQSDNVAVNNWTSHFATSNFAKMGLRRTPYAFTRNGIGMLSSVLRSETAVGVNIRIMRAFTAIPQVLNHNAQMIQRIFNIEQHQIETDEKINIIIERIEDLSPKLLPEQIFQTGCVWDAWSYVSELVRSAKQRIVLIDNFVDDRVLNLLTKREQGVTATIHTRYDELFLTDLKKHNEQYPEIVFVQLPHRNHDRFLIIDDKAYLLGASVKDIGAGLCAVTGLAASPETILGMLK